MRVIIVNDDRNFLIRLKKDILEIDDSLQVKEYDRFVSFNQDFNDFQEYSIFMIDLSVFGQKGMMLAKRINEQIKGAQIIFMGDEHQFTSEMYETKHCYFINKNNYQDYLFKALQKAINLIRQTHSFIVIKNHKKTIIIYLDEINYFERDLRKTIIHLQDQDYQTYENFKSFENLIPDNFFECHRSFIVNFNQVREYQKNRFTLIDGTNIPISRSHEKQAKIRFNNYLFYKSTKSSI